MASFFFGAGFFVVNTKLWHPVEAGICEYPLFPRFRRAVM